MIRLTRAIVLVGCCAAQAAAAPGDQLDKFTGDDTAAFDQFGIAAALDATTAIVGANENTENGPFSGAAYLFDISTSTQLHKLLASDGEDGDGFGGCVDISIPTVVVGAQGEDSNGSNSGAAYLFDAASGIETFKLLAPDGAGSDGFGAAVAVSGSLAAVGAPNDDDFGTNNGAVYIFNTATGAFARKIVPAGTNSNDLVGTAVAMEGTTVLIGAPGFGADGRGRAWLFDAASGDLLHTLDASDGGFLDKFGSAVALRDGIAIVGAEDGDGNQTDSGAAYLFDASDGAQLHKLTAPDGRTGDLFGAQGVSVSSDLALVGAHGRQFFSTLEGKAYLFDIKSGAFITDVFHTDTGGSDQFGRAVAIFGPTALVGSPFDAETGPGSGSAYLFETGATPGPCSPADIAAPFDQLDFSDVVAFLTAFGAMAPEADLAPPIGQWDFSDVVAFLTAFAAGCP